jgi:COP9 signalosome complex subunit 3
VISKIESSEVSAQISALDIVTFSDPTPQFSQADVDRVLQEALGQAEILRALEMEMSRSRDYLSKVRLVLFYETGITN